MRTCDCCESKKCRTGKLEELPANCPCREEAALENIKAEYTKEENLKIAHNSALVEAEGYCVDTRLEEIINFANKCGYHKIGVGFCAGLSNEAKILCRILRNKGFEVNSVACKNGSIPKEFIGITDEQKVRKCGFEAMCNPIGQAMFLNAEKTELNIIIGLCVGHDTLFIKYSEAPVTVFATKDRVTGHNPMAALYCADSYFKKRFN